jgi:hypothetical protein
MKRTNREERRLAACIHIGWEEKGPKPDKEDKGPSGTN